MGSGGDFYVHALAICMMMLLLTLMLAEFALNRVATFIRVRDNE